MAKQSEIDYLNNLGPNGELHALNKPFSDANCGFYLTDMGTVISLMPQPPAKVLDLGVGSGWTSVFFARRGYDVIGQDIAPDMIVLANKNKKRSGLDNLDFIVSDYEGLSYKSEFDVAVFYDCLHHCEDEESAMISVYNALKPGGILITAEPGEGHSKNEVSKEQVRKFGVNEKDMPPRLILELGRKIGFSRSQVFLRHTTPKELKESDYLPKRSLRELMRSLKMLIFGDKRLRKVFFNHPNFVVLTK